VPCLLDDEDCPLSDNTSSFDNTMSRRVAAAKGGVVKEVVVLIEVADWRCLAINGTLSPAVR
jgi:hypothetical protein